MALFMIKSKIMEKSSLVVNQYAMWLHYVCFILFLISCIVFYVADLIDPPTKNLQVNVATEILRVICIVML